ncbi:hypothetical protein KI387_031400, partial [Taxus chinensis]
GSISSGLTLARGLGSGGVCSSGLGGSSGSGGKGNIVGFGSGGQGPHQPQNIYMEMSHRLPEYRGIEDATDH